MKLTIHSANESDVYKDIARVREGHRKDCRGNPIPSGKICKLTINGKRKKAARMAERARMSRLKRNH